MVKIPIILRLKKEVHRETAKAQDLIILEMNNSLKNPVLHGGTAIWRCFNGNRFSEDIDVYIKKDIEKIKSFFNNLEKKGFTILKKKIGKNSLYSELKFNRVSVRFESLFRVIKGILTDYETAEGNFMTIYSLTPEQIIKEKIETYKKRLKIRDLYDIFFLLKYIKDKNNIKSELKKFISNFKNPIDEKELQVLILEGLIPNVKDMLNYIKNI